MKSQNAAPRDGAAPPLVRVAPKSRANSWEDVSDLAAALGMPLDEWQDMALEAAMGERADGRWASKFVGISAPRQNGKALDVATPILTANRGFVRMEDIVVGDLVFHPSGAPTPVVAVTDLMRDRPCYRVTSVDGRSVVADGNHDWTVIDMRREHSRKGSDGRRVRWFESLVMTTADMATAGLSRYTSGGRTSTTSGKTYATNEFRFRLPAVSPIQSPDANLPIDPYLFGAWLGDGTSTSGSLTTSTEDLPHWMDTILSCGFIPTAKPQSDGRAHRVGITCAPGRGRHTRSFIGALTRLGVRGNKHIPEPYLTASPTQREALLQGLMDTDGSISASGGQVEFCSTSRRLADGTLYLARSLGWRATMREGRAMLNGMDCGAKYRVCFTPKTTDLFRPFRMQRKTIRVRSADGGKGRAALSVASIEAVPSVPVRCIQVASADGLYLAGEGLMPTHNSQLIVARALAGVLLFGEKMIIISAHETDTAREVWKRLTDVVEANPTLEARVTGRMDAINREFLQFGEGLNKQTIKLKARRASGSRGFSSDCLLLDEAQILGKSAWGSIVPTMSARGKITSGGPQLWLFGTPPTSECNLFAFSRVRESAKAGKARHTWLEWAATPHDDFDSPATWAKANPAYGVRISQEACADDRAAMDDEQFALERLGIWSDTMAAADIFGPGAWAACQAEPDPDVRLEAIGVAATVDLSRVSIVGAGSTGERVQIKPLDSDAGLEWVLPRCRDLQERYGCDIVIDAGGPASRLIPALQEAGLEVTTPTAAEFFHANALGVESVRNATIAHAGHETLTAQVRDAKWRASERRALDRKKANVELLEGMFLALWAIKRPETRESSYADDHELVII